MPQDSLVEREGLRAAIRGWAGRAAVVHKTITHPQSPQRCGPHLVPGYFPVCLHYSIARPDVVQQEVAEGMDYLIAERVGHDECSAIDD